ncbi:GDSL-type esterase/lipase family protein [bacterium]|nr:GDSL-type esterase/lipase family protein [bacterium]
MFSKKNYIIIVLLSILLFLFVKDDYYNRTQAKLFKSKNSSSNNIINNSFDFLYSNNQFNYEIVMIGDSITEGVDWNELLGLNISNQGVGGDTTAMIIERLEFVVQENPSHVFIMAGINDIYSEINNDEIINNMNQIIHFLKKNYITIHIQSVLKVSYPQEKVLKKNIIIDQLNNQLYKLCVNEKIEFLDLNKILSDNNGLRKNFTNDGVHLNSNGYFVWSNLIFKSLTELGFYNK